MFRTGKKYNFDEIISRNETNSVSYDGWKQYMFHLTPDTVFPFSDRDIIRMWVADMDFATPEKILEAIKRRLDKKILGYTLVYDEKYFKVLSEWFLKRYQWQINDEEIVIYPGIVPALNNLIGLLTDEDDTILINTPSYSPFKNAGDYNNRKVYYSPLTVDKGHYTMDFEDIENKLKDPGNQIKVFIICNPHNPTGRVWTEEELSKVGELCLSRDIWIISDEIHCDLLRHGKRHIPLAKLFPETDRIITCTAPSKTFNLAGNLMSHIFIADEQLKEQWNNKFSTSLSPLSIAATQAAYEECEDWLEELKTYLDGNFSFLKDRLASLLPKAGFTIPEATYLAWINIAEYLSAFPEEDNIGLLFANSGVLLEDGNNFVCNGQGYIRINVACPRSVLNEGVTRIASLLHKR